MAVVNAINGVAPKGLKVGDFVNTNGGLFQIVHPGTPGSRFNPLSGYSSISMADNNSQNALIAYSQGQAERNTARSEAQADKQMNFQLASNAKAMEFNSRQAQINREWQEKMSNTAHQREVSDLIAAGLNPVLSASYGGSSTPSGSSASGVTSSGASGQVDTSASQMVGALLSAVISQSTALETTALNNMTYLKGSELSAGALLGSASISAQGAIEKQKIINDFEDYLRKNYPNTVTGGVSALVNAFVDLLTGPSAKDASKLTNFIRLFYDVLVGPDPRF